MLLLSYLGRFYRCRRRRYGDKWKQEGQVYVYCLLDIVEIHLQTSYIYVCEVETYMSPIL